MNATLAETFEVTFGHAATHLSRAPGRVNLIGEHTDYNDLPVLPMALRQAARIAVRPRRDGTVRLVNVDGEFAPVEFRLAPTIEPGPQGDWGNYARAAAQELARRYGVERGLDGVVTSDVPVAAGLSSSSALVNAVGLALTHINFLALDTLTTADCMADAERYTGMRGGGMDQAISLAALEGFAARIDFAPLRLDHVPVPGSWRFVVADTGVRAEKSGAAREAYNLRRAQCEEALARVLSVLAGRGAVTPGLRGYPTLIRTLGYEPLLTAGAGILDGDLARRFRHVVTEARRVDLACTALRTGDFQGFGQLMNASHASLSKDYDVSVPELDRLVELAREGGAVGARLTGAGFGGCIVALTDGEGVDPVLRSLRQEYAGPGGRSEDSGDRCFVAVPSGGASWQPIAEVESATDG